MKKLKYFYYAVLATVVCATAYSLYLLFLHEKHGLPTRPDLESGMLFARAIGFITVLAMLMTSPRNLVEWWAFAPDDSLYYWYEYALYPFKWIFGAVLFIVAKIIMDWGTRFVFFVGGPLLLSVSYFGFEEKNALSILVSTCIGTIILFFLMRLGNYTKVRSQRYAE